ncbi:MAG: tyrosine--tRNA ligase [Gammaproteobacteria bacterium]|nr:tyrosine--tRNA ligase [Gammaproteobacteria bacterium]
MANRDLIDHLRNLGLVAQVSAEDALADHLNSGSRTVYCGFDPTSDSLHVGNLVPLLALRRFQLAGHRPILLVGGATGMIGDPGGKTEERKLNPADLVQGYVEKIRVQASRFLDFECEAIAAIVVDNFEWTAGMTVINFLRDVGKHFSVNAMVQKESVRRRLEDDGSGISYTEFSYMVLQSYDYVVLNRRYDCTIQIGGSDQWGNITSGMDLIRRMEGGQAFAMTFPLITKSDGSKFGKSEEGTVWLDDKKTSPYTFYQFWFNCADEDVIPYIKIFTFFDDVEMARMRAAHEQDPGMRVAHIALAKSVTELVHGETGLTAALRITDALFSNKLDKLSEADLGQLALDGLPCHKVNDDEAGLIDLLVATGLSVTPRGEVTAGQARKFIKSNAISVNGQKVSDEETKLSRNTALYGRYHVLQRGKKNHVLVQWI